MPDPDREFRETVLSKLGAIEADLKNLCGDIRENHDTHEKIFDRLNAQDLKVTVVETEVKNVKKQAGLWGALTGAIMGASAFIAGWLRP